MNRGVRIEFPIFDLVNTVVKYLRISFLSLCILSVAAGWSGCKAKTCDAASNVNERKSSKRKVKNIGLFSRKEMRRKRWR